VSTYTERAALTLVLMIGLVPRLAVVSVFPTIPVSDFSALVAFGQHFQNHGLTSDGWFWWFFNPGLPLVLCGLFHLFPSFDPVAVARMATVLACGLVPILPFLMWRGVLPLWVRLVAGAGLALWPGHVLFSGTVAQDNWVLLPSVALGALAVRRLLGGTHARPLTAGLLYAAAVAIRQDMLVVLLPLLLAAGRVSVRSGWRRGLATCLAASLPLLALAAHRHASTGRFALNTEHGGVSILGAYVPGATANGWTDPHPYIASVRPDLLRDRKALFAQASSFVLVEVLRRPGYQVARMLSSVLTLSVSGEAASLYWSLSKPDVLPAAVRERGAALEARMKHPLRFEMAAIQGLFLAAVIIGVWRRNMAILVLSSAVLLKYALHAVVASQGRYFFMATALEMLAIAIAAYELRQMAPPDARRLLPRALAVGMAFGLGLLLFAPVLAAFVQRRDIDDQRTYRFQLGPRDGGAVLACVIDRGLLAALDPPRSASLRTLLRDPAPGDAAVAACELTGSGAPRPLVLQVLDTYAPGGFGGRMMQRVEVDGVEVLSHDIAQEPGSGWANIPMGPVGTGTTKRILIAVKAIRPDPGLGWGDEALTTFRFVRPE